MKRRGLTIGAFVLAVVLLVLGLVLQSQADFSSNYVKTQFAERGIIFTPADALLPAQKKVRCLVANAGKPLTTGKQAECYAKYQIGIDLTLVDNGTHLLRESLQRLPRSSEGGHRAPGESGFIRRRSHW